MNAVIDNDVLLKGACYGLLDRLIWTTSATNGAGVLGSARFVVPSKIKKAKLNQDRGIALQALLAFMGHTASLEPSNEEQELAADFELIAQEVGANLDVGESQLCAIVVQRVIPLLVTGDKRAIAAIEAILDADTRLKPICGRVKCLEQIFVASIVRCGCDTLRLAVCAEPWVDKALSICFSCRTQPVGDASIREGLQSYIGDLRRRAGRVLAP
jgi:hypothetical protein